MTIFQRLVFEPLEIFVHSLVRFFRLIVATSSCFQLHPFDCCCFQFVSVQQLIHSILFIMQANVNAEHFQKAVRGLLKYVPASCSIVHL